MKIREIGGIMYEVVDIERSIAFYRDTLGLKLLSRPLDGMAIFKSAPNSQVYLVLRQKDVNPTAEAYAVLVVDNVVAAVEELKGQDVTVLSDAEGSLNEWLTIVADPDGNRVGLYEEKGPTKESFSIGQASETLERYYGRKLQGKGNVGISDIAYIEEGLSNYMYSFRLEYDEGTGRHSENLILRASRDEGQLRREFQALQKLYPTSIPVPKVYDMGEEIPGFSFTIMEKIEGQTMFNALDSMTEEAEKTELWKQFSRILADINTLDWRSIGFDFLDPPEGEYGHINRWLSSLWERVRGLELDYLNPIVDWLEANKLPSDHYVLLHDDYHPENVMVNKGEIAAIVDWQGVCIGDAADDVCWPPLIFRAVDPSDEWRSSLTETFLGHYREMTGRELQNFDFYLILKAVDLLFHILRIKIHGTEELGMKTEAESLVRPDSGLLGACIEVVKEKTGIDISSAVENIGG